MQLHASRDHFFCCFCCCLSFLKFCLFVMFVSLFDFCPLFVKLFMLIILIILMVHSSYFCQLFFTHYNLQVWQKRMTNWILKWQKQDKLQRQNWNMIHNHEENILVQTYPNLTKLVQTCPNVSKLVQICIKLSKPV